MKKILSLLFFVASCSSVFGEIIEAPHFRDLKGHVTKDTLVILDIDDTLLIPEQMLGCDEWFNYRIKSLKEKGLSGSDALEKAIADWEAIRHLTKMDIVEPGTEGIVNAIQQEGHVVMGLTTQGLGLATRTVHQLKEKGIDLSKASPSKEEHYLANNGHGVIYRKGVLFTSGTDKGVALFQLLDKVGFQPKKIVFINDKATHLADIEKTAKIRNVPFVGLRYSYSDARKAAFRPEIAEYQWAHSNFGHLLSDKEARENLLKSNLK